VGYCFVTGLGSKPSMRIHHRQSQADGIVDPVPGLLAGGPNPRREDGCSGYIGPERARSYLDDVCSYASNEIAINWNAPLVYLTGAIEALYSPTGKPTGVKEERNGTVPDGYGLLQNYPNPVNPATNIPFFVGSDQWVGLKVFDVLGNEVATLVDEKKPAGNYRVRFDAARLASGVYFYQLKAGSSSGSGQSFVATKKMIVVQ
jgi:endoglucanase